MRHPLHLGLLSLVLIVAACSAAPGASGPASSPTNPATATTAPSQDIASQQPTSAASDKASVGTVYTGVLSIDEIEGGCVYLQSPDGQKLQVIYPDGWSTRKAPLKLIAPDGSVHSRGGDVVSIRGSESTEMASICQIGPIIEAIEVLDR